MMAIISTLSIKEVTKCTYRKRPAAKTNQSRLVNTIKPAHSANWLWCTISRVQQRSSPWARESFGWWVDKHFGDLSWNTPFVNDVYTRTSCESWTYCNRWPTTNDRMSPMPCCRSMFDRTRRLSNRAIKVIACSSSKMVNAMSSWMARSINDWIKATTSANWRYSTTNLARPLFLPLVIKCDWPPWKFNPSNVYSDPVWIWCSVKRRNITNDSLFLFYFHARVLVGITGNTNRKGLIHCWEMPESGFGMTVIDTARHLFHNVSCFHIR